LLRLAVEKQDRDTLNELQLSYDSLKSFYGIEVRRDRAVKINVAARQVELKSGTTLPYDHLVVATGISLKKPSGVDFNKTPHAWIAGSQTKLLASKIRSMGAGDTFVMTVPKAPYRCPPGPYERACLVADILKRKGGGRVTLLDANPMIQAERETFDRAFRGIYDGIVDYLPSVTVREVVPDEGLVVTDFGDFTGKVVNIIPQQRAPGFVRAAGLAANGGWASVDPLSYASTVSGEGYAVIHTIGDAQGSNQPKSAHMANAQAKVCADAIIRILAGDEVDNPERRANVTTNSACYSPITYDEASWLTANYAYDENTGQMKGVHVGEAEEWSRGNYRQMFAWASNLFTDSFH
jgi:NADPH-dependent 2,4-dienoyl-CoA reductase/sulfur reductase-like enzyme